MHTTSVFWALSLNYCTTLILSLLTSQHEGKFEALLAPCLSCNEKRSTEHCRVLLLNNQLYAQICVSSRRSCSYLNLAAAVHLSALCRALVISAIKTLISSVQLSPYPGSQRCRHTVTIADILFSSPFPSVLLGFILFCSTHSVLHVTVTHAHRTTYDPLP